MAPQERDSSDRSRAKQQQRQAARTRRAQADAPQVSDSICDELAQFLIARDEPEQWTVLFAPLAGEPDVLALTTRALPTRFALTRTPESSMLLTVHDANGPTELHRFGFQQPLALAPRVADEHVGVVLVPGLAFDRSGGRLGFGAGYYDRFLSRVLDASGSEDVDLVGVCFEEPVAELATESHDVAMTHLVTPSGLIRCQAVK